MRESFRFEPPPSDAEREPPFFARDNYGPPPRIELFATPDIEPHPKEKKYCEIIIISEFKEIIFLVSLTENKI